MNMKETTKKAAKPEFNGKAIYNPKGKAGEYAPWACNFYTGCSNDCEYCYCKRGFLSHVWDDVPHLKKCFKDVTDALYIFEFELRKNLKALRKESIFFTFSSDPLLPEVKNTYYAAAACALSNGVPVQFLTKRADFVNDHFLQYNSFARKRIAFGFTLTGCDDKEPGASTNQERIEAMKILHERGFMTFASIEPIVDIEASKRMITETLGFCDLYKIGLMSGVKRDYYKDEDLRAFMWWLADLYTERRIKGSVSLVNGLYRDQTMKIYIKQSIRDRLGDSQVINAISVSSDYDIFRREIL